MTATGHFPSNYTLPALWAPPNSLSGFPQAVPLVDSELTLQLSSLLFFVHVVPYTGDAMASTLPSDILSTLGFISNSTSSKKPSLMPASD